MFGAKMIDGPLDRSPAALLIREVFGIGRVTIGLPVGTMHFIRQTRLEVVRIEFRMICQTRENTTGFIENRAFYASRDIRRQLMRMRIVAPVS